MSDEVPKPVVVDDIHETFSQEETRKKIAAVVDWTLPATATDDRFGYARSVFREDEMPLFLCETADAVRAAHLGRPLPGEPCGHPGCLSHVTHPCEGCGRTAGRPTQPTSTNYPIPVFCLATNELAPTVRVYAHPQTYECCRCRVCATVLSRLDWTAFTDRMDSFVLAHSSGGTFSPDVSDVPRKPFKKLLQP